MGQADSERLHPERVSWINKWSPEEGRESLVAKALARIGLSARNPESERPFLTTVLVHQLHAVEDGPLRLVLLAQAADRRGPGAEIIFPVVLMPDNVLDHSVRIVKESHSIAAAITRARSSASL